MTVNRRDLDARAAEVQRYISMHAGGIRIADVSPDGDVTVEFTGMCTGCPYRPVTMAATVRPALMEIGGVASVEAVGSRVSREAQRRLEAGLAGGRTGVPAWISRRHASP